MSNIISFEKRSVVSVEVESFPAYYKHSRIQFYIMLGSTEESIKIFDSESWKSVSITLSNQVKDAFDDDMIPCTREEFEAALESAYEKIATMRSIQLHKSNTL